MGAQAVIAQGLNSKLKQKCCQITQRTAFLITALQQPLVGRVRNGDGDPPRRAEQVVRRLPPWTALAIAIHAACVSEGESSSLSSMTVHNLFKIASKTAPRQKNFALSQR